MEGVSQPVLHDIVACLADQMARRNKADQKRTPAENLSVNGEPTIGPVVL